MKYFWAAAFLLLTFALAWIYPPLFSFRGESETLEQKWHAKLASNSIKGPAYLSSLEERSIGIVTDINVTKKIDLSLEVNLGLYEQPISRPLLLADSVITASDYGSVERRDYQGELLWRYRLANSRTGIATNILFSKGSIFFGGMDGFLYALSYESGDLLWALKVANYVGCELILDQGRLITCGTLNDLVNELRFVSVDPQRGEVLWRHSIAGEGGFFSAYKLAEQLVFHSFNGRTFLLDPEKLSLKEYPQGIDLSSPQKLCAALENGASLEEEQTASLMGVRQDTQGVGHYYFLEREGEFVYSVEDQNCEGKLQRSLWSEGIIFSLGKDGGVFFVKEGRSTPLKEVAQEFYLFHHGLLVAQFAAGGKIIHLKTYDTEK